MRKADVEIQKIIDAYAALIRKAILSHLSSEKTIDPQDIEQEIRIKLWKSLRHGKQIENLPSYIRKVAYTTTIDEMRRLKKQVPYRDALNMRQIFLEGDDPQVRETAQPEAGYDRKQSRRRLEVLLKGLSPDRRKVLWLYAAGMSIDEICEHCGWDKTRVRHLLYRGIDALRQKNRDAPEHSYGKRIWINEPK